MRRSFGFGKTLSGGSVDANLLRLQQAIAGTVAKIEDWASQIEQAQLSGTTQIEGESGHIQEVDQTTKAARVTIRPVDPGVSYGHYKLAARSGLTTTIGAGSPVFSFRWSDTSRVATVERLRVTATVVTGFTTAQELSFSAYVARSFSVSDSGGTSVTPTGNTAKARTTYGTSLAGDIRISTTTALSTGTRTLDGQPFMTEASKTLAAAATVQDAKLSATLDAKGAQAHPIVLSANEGIVVTNDVLMGAAGTVRWGVEIWWTEAATF